MKTFLTWERKQEVQRVPYRIKLKKNISIHTVIKMTETKDKERISKAAREKHTNNIQGNLHNVIS